MKFSNALVCIMILFTFAFSSCGGGTSNTDNGGVNGGGNGDNGGDGTGGGDTNVTYVNKNLPAQVTISLPKSLTGEVSEKTKSRALCKVMEPPASNGSVGYFMLKQSIEMMKSFTGGLDIDFMIVDAALEKIKADMPGDGTKSYAEGELKITWTQAMANKEKEVFGEESESVEAGANKDDSDEGDVNFEVGKDIPCPAMTYTRDSADSDGDGYNHVLKYETSGEETSVYILKWNDAKTKIFVSDQYSFSATYPGQTTPVTIAGSQKLVFDKTETNAKMNVIIANKMDGMDSSMTFNFRETGIKNGVLIDALFVSDFKGVKISNSIEGLADDDGGYVSTIYKGPDPMGGMGIVTYSYKESFNSAGSIISASYSTDGGSSYQAIPGSSYTPYEETEYEESYTETYQGCVDTFNLAISGNGTEGVTYIILPSGSVIPEEGAEDEFNSKVIGVAAYTNVDGKATWEMDYWGTEAQIEGAVIFEASYTESVDSQGNKVESFSYRVTTGLTLSKTAATK